MVRANTTECLRQAHLIFDVNHAVGILLTPKLLVACGSSDVDERLTMAPPVSCAKKRLIAVPQPMTTGSRAQEPRSLYLRAAPHPERVRR